MTIEMKFQELLTELPELTRQWETVLAGLSEELIRERRNRQNRSIRQIVGHMVDSASNNTHRLVHLHYQESPFYFPNYATEGNNDRWIAIQHYQEEDWQQLLQLWKYSNLHFIHVVRSIDAAKLGAEWIAAQDETVTMEEMVGDYLRHFKLHLDEIASLMNT